MYFTISIFIIHLILEVWKENRRREKAPGQEDKEIQPGKRRQGKEVRNSSRETKQGKEDEENSPE